MIYMFKERRLTAAQLKKKLFGNRNNTFHRKRPIPYLIRLIKSLHQDAVNTETSIKSWLMKERHELNVNASVARFK